MNHIGITFFNPMEMKQKYELMIIVSSIISDEEVKKHVNTIKDLLGDEIVYEEIWGMRPFAYRIKNQEKGYYVVWNFMQDPTHILSLEKEFQLMPQLLRHLISKVPENYEPLSLKEIEAGLEKLRKEKEEKRGSTKPSGEKRKEKMSDEKAPPKETEEKKNEEKGKDLPVDEPIKEKEPEVKKKRTLDEKLEDILSDADLGL